MKYGVVDVIAHLLHRRFVRGVKKLTLLVFLA